MASRGGRSGTLRRERAPAREQAQARAPPLPRALADHPDLVAALALGLLVLVYLWPALVGGKVLSPASVLYSFAPWQGAVPPDVLGYWNPLLSDVPMAVHPWRAFARELIHSGTFPAWNPHSFAGVPFFSNPQNGLFTPFNLPLWILPLNYGLGLSAALKLWAGGFGSYLLARQLRLGFLPGLLAGVAFSFSALNIVWLTHETLPAVAVMLPWAVLFVERIFERGRLGSVAWLAVVVAIGLGGGHPGMQLHLLVIVGLYAVLRALATPAGELGERLRPLALAGGGIVLGALLMAFMLIPEALSSRGTIGTAARHGGEGTLPGSTMPFDAIKTVLFPDWWGRPSAFEVEEVSPASAGGSVNYNERTFYAGVVALLLACVGLLGRDGWRRKAPFAALGFFGLAVALHAPVLYWVMTHLPFLADVQQQRIHFVFAFAVAVLAAFGLRALLDRPAEVRWRLAVPALAVVVAIAAVAGAGAQPGDAGRVVTHFLSGTDYQSAGVVALTSVAWFALLALGVGGALLAAWRWPRRVAVVGALVVALAAVDAFHFAHGYQPMGPAEKVFPPSTPAIEFLQRHRDEGRFIGLGYGLTSAWSLTYGLRDVRGYDPPYPTKRFYALWRLANPTQSDWQPFIVDGLSAESLGVLSVLGVRYVLTEPGVEVAPESGLRRVYAGEDATIFLNARAAPRALIPSSIELAAAEGEARALLIESDFDPRTSVVVERSEPGAAELASAEGARGSVRVVEEGNARVTLRAALDQPGLVILNDQLTDGWRVEVDGRDADVVRVNEVMRGVAVEAGEHEVEWRYGVPGLRVGVALTVAALLVLLGVGAAPVARARTHQLG